MRKTWSMTKKGHQKFWPWKWNFFPKKTSFRNLGPLKKFLFPSKLGARSPPLLIAFYCKDIVMVTNLTIQWWRPGAEFGGTNKFFADQDFWMTFFRKQFPCSRPKFLMIFFSHWTGFSDFPFLLPDFPYLLLLCSMSYMTVSSQEQPLFQKKFLYDTFFTLFVLSRALLFKIFGGTDAWAVPHLKFLGDPPPSPP